MVDHIEESGGGHSISNVDDELRLSFGRVVFLEVDDSEVSEVHCRKSIEVKA